jgi:hypothetical protein
VRHRVDLRGRLHALAAEAGARDHGVLADRLLLLIDGLYANGAVLGGDGAATAAVAFAQDVVDQATTSG